MNLDKPFLNPQEPTSVAWARRRETMTANLKMLRVVLDAVRRHAQWVESKHGLDAASLCLLWELSQSPGRRAVDLAKILAATRATIEAMLSDLERRNLVLRSAMAGTVAYACTDHGRWVAESAREYAPGVLKTAMGQLPDESLEGLAQALSGLVEHLPFRDDRAALQPMAEVCLSPDAGARMTAKGRR